MNELHDLMATAIMPAALPVLREACLMPGLIANNYAPEAFELNETIHVPLPVDLGKADDMDTFIGSQSTPLEAGKVAMRLDKWKYKQFGMSDKEMAETVRDGVLPKAADAALRSLANSFDMDIWELYKDIPFFAGTAGLTPNTKDALTLTRKIMQDNLCPIPDRRLVLDTSAEAEYLKLFSDFDRSGSPVALERALLGMKIGFVFYADQLAPFHLNGSFGAYGATPKVAVGVAGASTIAVTGGAGTETLKRGDIFTIDGIITATGGRPMPFLVLDDYVAIGGDIPAVKIFPALPKTIPTNSNIKVVASQAFGAMDYAISLAFSRDAFLIAMRSLANEMSETSTITVAIDPVTGMPLRLETWRDPVHGTRHWRFDCLYGVRTLRRELACRLHG
jgi:P22 coat protein - gene protein 5